MQVRAQAHGFLCAAATGQVNARAIPARPHLPGEWRGQCGGIVAAGAAGEHESCGAVPDRAARLAQQYATRAISLDSTREPTRRREDQERADEAENDAGDAPRPG